MNFDQEKLGLDFVQHRRKYFTVSAAIILIGVIFTLFMGFNLGVDFAGGTRVEVLMEQPNFDVNEVLEVVTALDLAPDDIPRVSGNNNEIVTLYYLGTITPEKMAEMRNALRASFGTGTDITEETVSPIIARELAQKAALAIIYAAIGVIIYVSIRFEYRFAISAIVALLHDALIIIAIFSILRLQVDLTFIAAVLTIVGYSINDTIVIFDRIRENMKFMRMKTPEDVSALVNKSIVDTLARSINTSLTVVFAAATLYLFGAEAIRNFSFALLIGLIAGAYSSLFIAAQVWMVLKTREVKKKIFQQAE